MSLHISGSVLVNGRGRAGVAISNGEMVVRTDASGRYRLHVDPTRHRFVFVVVPDGTNPVRSFYRPVASFSESGEGVDFELDRADVRARRNFMFAQFTDVHAKLESGVASSTGLLGKDVRKALSEWDAAFVVAKAVAAGKVVAMMTGSEEQARRYIKMGARILFAGVDISFKRRAFNEAMAPLQAARQSR